MTDTIPAAALGLPTASTFDRRSFLATLAAAGVMTGATLPANAAGHPDARLMEIIDLYKASEARQEAYDRQAEEALDRCNTPPIPDALYLRDDEPRHLHTSFEPLESVTIDGEVRHFYARGVEDLTHGAQQYDRLGEDYSLVKYLSEEARARIREIKQVHLEWRTDVQAAEDAACVTGPRVAGDAESAVMDVLTEEIIKTRASTVEGLRCKAQFALLFYGNVDRLEREGVLWLLSRGGVGIAPALGASLIIDIVKLGDAGSAQVAA